MEVRAVIEVLKEPRAYISSQIQALGRKTNTESFLTQHRGPVSPVDGEAEERETPTPLPLNSISLAKEQDDVDSERMALYDIRMTMPNTVVSTYQCTKADIQLIRLLAEFGRSPLRGHRRELFDARARRLLDRHVLEG